MSYFDMLFEDAVNKLEQIVSGLPNSKAKEQATAAYLSLLDAKETYYGNPKFKRKDIRNDIASRRDHEKCFMR